MFRTTKLYHLPHEIITDILTRLPFEYAIQCKEVCKTWRNILHHIKRDIKTNLLFVGHEDRLHLSRQLYHGEYDANSKRTIHEQLSIDALTPMGDPNVPYTNRLIVGSHRGLVCFVMNNKNLGCQILDYDDPIYICNPFAKETVRLPPPPPPLPNNGRNYFLVIGFGYLYATNEYKIVRIYCSINSSEGQVQVYTLGDKSGGWRNTCITDNHLKRLEFSNGILFNGALHWISYKDTEIVAFDLADEKFHTFPIPARFLLECDYVFGPQLLLLGGYLSIALVKSSSPRGYCLSTEIWSLKQMKDPKLESNYEFTVHFDAFPPSMCHPVALKDENNKVLLWDLGRGTNLCYYDPETATPENLEYDRFHVFRVIPYTKSDVSLTVLGAGLPVVTWDS